MKVTDSKTVSQISKTKKSGKASKASGVSFESLVEKAGAVEAASAVDAVDAISLDQGARRPAIPADAEGRSGYLLDILAELEQDILSGHKSLAIRKLQDALAAKVLDSDTVPPKLKELLSEIELRAALEIAKVEEGQ